jgi:hypothetical protein
MNILTKVFYKIAHKHNLIAFVSVFFSGIKKKREIKF